MKKLVYLLIAVSFIMALVPAVASAHTEDDPFVTDLIAGGGNPKSAMDAGDVLVWNDGEYLHVKYVTAGEWCLTETHLHVATALDGIPQKQGNPIPGHFNYQMEHDPCVTEYIYVIDLNGWEPGTELFIAAHAVACRPGEEEGVYETAWGAGYDFPGRNWATYFRYTVQGEIPVEWPEGGTVTIAFEDLPIASSSDYDYNDWVADIDILATFWGTETEHPNLVKIDFTITPEARGAGYDHIFHLLIQASTFGSDGDYTLTLFDGDGNVVEKTTGIFDASLDNDFVVIPWTRDALPGVLTNTIEDEPYVPPQRTATLSIVFDTPSPFDLALYDPYDPAHMHGEGLFFDPYLYVVDWSGSINQGDPRMLAVPVDWMWPEEFIAIWMAYPDVTPGNPPSFTAGWWVSYNNLVYDGKP